MRKDRSSSLDLLGEIPGNPSYNAGGAPPDAELHWVEAGEVQRVAGEVRRPGMPWPCLTTS